MVLNVIVRLRVDVEPVLAAIAAHPQLHPGVFGPAEFLEPEPRSVLPLGLHRDVAGLLGATVFGDLEGKEKIFFLIISIPNMTYSIFIAIAANRTPILLENT